MGKKTKVGKQRRDKFYQLAKETGYRARSAFKLIQLNRKFEFLQKCKVVVDLCAAPGGWCQVAAQNMPPSSIILGVDLVPIKAIPGVITLQGDITTDKTRSEILKTLQSWPVDAVLHDGAPNVGRSWVQDAFSQAVLTLHALRLASSILRKGGWFVTKVFRSKDYLALISVFNQLFKKVHATKPQASRNESAEIFVCCTGYLKPDKVNPALLDSKLVFKDLNVEPEKENFKDLQKEKRKKKAAEGYAEESAHTGLLYNKLNASQFVTSDNYLELLSNAHQIVLDEERFEQDPLTTDEVRACLADIKVLGKKSLRDILNWRKKLRKPMIQKAKEDAGKADAEAEGSAATEEQEGGDDTEEAEAAEMDRLISEAKGEEKRVLKKKKRKMLKEKALKRKKAELQMEISGDRPDVPEDQELFSLKTINTSKKLAVATVRSQAEADEVAAELDESDGEVEDDGQSEDDEEEHPLLHDTHVLSAQGDRAAAAADAWFSRAAFADLMPQVEQQTTVDEDEPPIDEQEEAFLQSMYQPKSKKDQRKERKKVKEMKAAAHSSESVTAGGSAFQIDRSAAAPDSDDEHVKDDDDDEDMEFEVVPSSANEPSSTSSTAAAGGTSTDTAAAAQPAKKRVKLSAEALAMGELLTHSTKTRRDLVDWAYNRYTNNDQGLPDWFVEDERKHWRPMLPVNKAVVAEYKEREKQLNVRPIKKVAEAKMRKKKRLVAKMNRARKKAESVVENEELSSQEKRRQLQKTYEKVKAKKPEVKYVKMKKGKRGTMSRPKGPYKMVDSRLKKDMRAAKTKEKTKGRSGKKAAAANNRSKAKKSPAGANKRGAPGGRKRK